MGRSLPSDFLISVTKSILLLAAFQTRSMYSSRPATQATSAAAHPSARTLSQRKSSSFLLASSGTADPGDASNSFSQVSSESPKCSIRFSSSPALSNGTRYRLLPTESEGVFSPFPNHAPAVRLPLRVKYGKSSRRSSAGASSASPSTSPLPALSSGASCSNSSCVPPPSSVSSSSQRSPDKSSSASSSQGSARSTAFLKNAQRPL